MPVHLSRDLVRNRYIYRLSGRDEDLEVNIALRELLRRQFGLWLPEVGEDDAPESYFAKIEPLIVGAKRLSIRRFITIGIFPFPRMALWADLDPQRWPSNSLLAHEQVALLLGGRGDEGAPAGFPPDHDIEAEPAPKAVPPLIMPADVSQHSALVEVVSGQSLAIEGPPGTGKSQTIANMIGAALDRGQRVLFLAEKRAALDVVAERLSKSGFGPLMLQLHSDRATKAEVMQALRERMSATVTVPGPALARMHEDLRQQRDTLRRYVSLLRREIGALGRPVNALYWRFLTLHDQLAHSLPRSLIRHTIVGAEEVSALDLKWKRVALDAVEKAATQIQEAYGSITRSPWHATRNLKPTSFDQDEVRQQLNAVVISVDRLQAVCEDFTGRTGVSVPSSESDTVAWLSALARLPMGAADVCQARLRTALRAAEPIRSLVRRLERYRDNLGRAAAVHPAPLAADLGAFSALDAVLRALDCDLTTAAALQRRWNDTRDWLKDVARLDACLRPVCDKVRVDADTATAYGLRVLTAVFRRLREAPSDVLRLRKPNLLDDDAATHLAAGKAAAADLREREAALSERINLKEAVSLGAEALDRYASAICDAGIFTRILSSRYKDSLRSTRALCTQTTSNRAVLVELLRATAQWLRDAGTFRENAALAEMFGAAWQGHTSDFTRLEAARSLLESLAGLLLPAGMSECLRLIAGEPTPVLQAIATQAQLDSQSDQVLARIDASLTLPQVLEAADELEAQLGAAIAAAAAAGVSSDSEIRTAEPSTIHLFHDLHALHREISIPPDSTELWGWYLGPQEDLEKLAAALSVADAITAANLPTELAAQIADSSEPGTLVADLIKTERALRAQLQAVRDAWRDFSQAVGTDAQAFLKVPDSASTSWGQARSILTEAHADTRASRWFADLQKFLMEAETRQVRFIYDAFVAADQPIHGLADAFEFLLIETLLKHFLATDGTHLMRLGGVSLDQARQRFRILDGEAMALEGRRIVADRLAQQPPRGVDWGPKSGWTELGLIRNELNKQKRHIPIRDLVARATKTLQALKPVWLMSPMSVAQYMSPGSAAFDLVIIDEASQMRPEFAIGAIARGTQVVVVGDPKQLPPTDFFQTHQADPDADADVAVESESILDLALARLSNVRRLRWHYRSRHASLITFSNRMFYDRDLVVFPNAMTEDPILGVKYTYVNEGTYSNHINRAEAQAVIERALALIYANPDLSLGIATMNVDQRDLIFAEFERISEEDARIRDYMDRHAATIEPFFVKNLENIQGDERDIILVSTCYGPAPGTSTVAQRFGPINSATGHRRLNVLFTRAKMTTEVFTSLRPTDIVVGPDSREGVKAFRAYLEYAAGGAVVDDAEGGEPDSDFEEFVADRLRAAGYEVIPQVGVERFRIDLGVRHPSYPLGFLAGIECDGATYHAPLTVRDRDRIRQDILEGLGWRIYRIWSTDWFNDRERETARLLRWLEEHRAREAARYESRRSAIEEAEAVRPRSDATEPDRQHTPLLPAAKSRQPAITPARRRTVRPATVPVAGQADLLRPGHPSEPRPVERPLPLVPRAATDTVPVAPQPRPEGRKRNIDGIDYYEVQPGYWEVWIDGRLAGDIQRLSRAPVLAARLYGNRVVAPVTHYQATMAETNEMFNVDDIYEAVRGIATRVGASSETHALRAIGGNIPRARQDTSRTS
jgi:very-short-patch-repair endonuclease